MISPPSNREAFIIESVREMFLVLSFIGAALKDSTVTPGRAIYISLAVSLIAVPSWSPLGNITRRRKTSFSSQVKRRGSIKGALT